MDRIRNLNTYQTVIIGLLLAMLLIFTFIYGRATGQEGYSYKEEVLLPSYEDGKTIYSGKVYDADCSFTVTEDKVVSFRCEDKYYGPYTAVEDSSAIPDEYADNANAVGVELLDNGKQMFRGVVLTNQPSGLLLFSDTGEMYGFGIVVTMSDGSRYDENGLPIDPWEPSVYNILELMGQPELTKKGEWMAYFLAVFVSVCTVISILFAEELFRLGLMGRVRDWDRAEPSDFEVAGRYIGWTIMMPFIAWIYLMGLK